VNILQTIEKTIKYKTELIEVAPSLVLIVNRQNSKIGSYSLVERKTLKINKKKKTYDVKDKERKIWRYYSPEIFDEIKTKHFTEIKNYGFEVNAFKEFKEKGKLDQRRILWFDRGSHLVYRLGQEVPISGVFIFNYIGGVTNEHFHILKAYKYLEKRKSVIHVEIEDIPYYNRSPGHTKSLSMTVLLPQTVMNKIWNEVKSDKFPSCRVPNVIMPKYYEKYKVDPLGLKKFQKSKAELEEADNEIRCKT